MSGTICAIAEGARVRGIYVYAMRASGKLLRSFARFNIELQVAMGYDSNNELDENVSWLLQELDTAIAKVNRAKSN